MVEITKIKLDKVDRKILTELDKNCRIPSSRLAKIVRKSRQTVEYRIDQLTKKGIITSFNTAINPHKMGHKIYKIYLELKNIPEIKEKLFSELRSSEMVYWMGEFSGKWDLIFAIFAKTDQEFFELKNKIISEYNNIIISEEGGTLLDVKQYPKMYLTNEISKPTAFGGEIIDTKLDELDHNLLEILVNNARISVVDLAKQVGSTPIIVKNRMKKLEVSGVIIQYRIGIDINTLGLDLYKVIIKLDRYTKKDQAKLSEYLSRIPNIHYFIRNLWQIEPELVVETYKEFYLIIENLKKEFPGVIRSVDSLLMVSDEWTPGFKNLIKKKNQATQPEPIE
jgi:DNA-binding Lrp family transcriptional regulator